VTSPPVTASLHDSPTLSQHSVQGPTSLEVAAGRLSSVDSPIAIPRLTGGQSSRSIALPATSFFTGLGTQGIIKAAMQVMGSEYLDALKKADLDVVEAKIQEGSMIYKGIERLSRDLTPLRKKVEDYGSAVSSYLCLKKAASLCCHLTVVGQQKTACIEEVELA